MRCPEYRRGKGAEPKPNALLQKGADVVLWGSLMPPPRGSRSELERSAIEGESPVGATCGGGWLFPEYRGLEYPWELGVTDLQG